MPALPLCRSVETGIDAEAIPPIPREGGKRGAYRRCLAGRALAGDRAAGRLVLGRRKLGRRVYCGMGTGTVAGMGMGMGMGMHHGHAWVEGLGGKCPPSCSCGIFRQATVVGAHKALSV
jgi:hypothetical protein